MATPLRRSYLFVPGNRPDRFAKALAAGADAVIIDLEDAVPPAEKVAARERVAAWLSPERRVLVRVNAFGTEWFHDDVGVCRNGVAGVMLPKTEDDRQIVALHTHIGAHLGAHVVHATPVLPIVETAFGLSHMERIARAPHVERLVFGALDLALDLQVNGDDGLLAFRSQMVLVSRIVGLQAPVDAPTTSFTDPDRVRADAERSRRLGFGAKLCIHPAQVAPVHEAFAPTPDEIMWARRVVEASAQSQGAATALDGAMVDRPVVERARAILERAG
jgi:citrate lyase subunit beta/citryl-CoA lyase